MKIVSLALVLAPCLISSIYPVCNDDISTPDVDEFLRNPSSYWPMFEKWRKTWEMYKIEMANAQTEVANLRSKLADEKLSKMYYLFLCAMDHFKVTTEYVFDIFNLKSLPVSRQYLPGQMHSFIMKSDSFMKGENRISVQILDPDLGYAKWLKLVTCKEGELCYSYVHWYSKPLLEKLDDYFDSHRSELKHYNIRFPITSLDTFYQYFAITMQRIHKLGCLYERELRKELNKFAGGKEDFVDVFHKLMPDWSIGQLEIDLVNIAWYVGGGIKSMDADQRLLAGYDLGNKYKNMIGKVIPISHNCLKTTAPVKI